jgi:hypothetical protein
MRHYHLLLALLGLVITQCRPPTPILGELPEEDRRHGDEIVAALEKYHSVQGHYPDTLAQLESEYISEIKPPRYGQGKWDYVTYGGKDTFALFLWGVNLTDNGYGYNVPEPEWTRIENSF